jgi:hypothetical protein
MADTIVSIDTAAIAPPISSVPAAPSAPPTSSVPAVTTAPTGKKARKRNDDNEAIVRCMRAWNYTYKKGRAEDLSDYQAEKAANQAYLRAAPPLRGYKNICDFIACINFASISDIVIPRDAQHYLANAKLALSAVFHKPKPLSSEPKPLGRPPKSAPPNPPQQEEIK